MMYLNSLKILSQQPSFPSLTVDAAEMLKIIKNPIFQWMKVPVSIMKYGFSLPFTSQNIGSLVRG